MRTEMWSRSLLSAGLLSLALFALPAAAAETGTQVRVKLQPGQELPEGEKLVEAVMGVGEGERQVQLHRLKKPEGEELTMKLWGHVVPQADIPRTLREGFPALASADIQVSTLDASERPKLEALEAPHDGKRMKRIIRKEVKDVETQRK